MHCSLSAISYTIEYPALHVQIGCYLLRWRNLKTQAQHKKRVLRIKTPAKMLPSIVSKHCMYVNDHAWSHYEYQWLYSVKLPVHSLTIKHLVSMWFSYATDYMYIYRMTSAKL